MTLLKVTKQCSAPKKFAAAAKTSKLDTLNHLKKQVELQSDQAKTYEEECQTEIETNQETIRKLRSEISTSRMLMRSARTNECLMRQALPDHHTGSSIYLEREPRDVNECVDYKISDLRNKLNKLRHTNRLKRRHLENLLSTSSETMGDVAFHELEGPVLDKRCLAIESKIGGNDKKYIGAEMVTHTYTHIRDQLAAERLLNQSALDAVNKILRCHKEELFMCRQSRTKAIKGKEIAETKVFKTEHGLNSIRKDRKVEISDYKKRTEEEKHEFATLWKTIQAHFAAQESVPLSHMKYHSRLSLSSSTELHNVDGLLEHSEEELELIKNVTGSHTFPDVTAKYEKQESTYHFAKSLAKELEVQKACLLGRLEELNMIRESLLHRAETGHDAQLRAARSSDSRPLQRGGWGRQAACRRVTQALARLRQLLEYLTDVLVSAELVEPPEAHDVSDTAAHLRTLLASTCAGATALMSSLQAVEPEEAERAAAAAAAGSLLTRSELSGLQRRAQLERDTPHDDIGYGDTDGDTTGDDAVPSRASIKRQAQLILMARQKSGSRGRKK